MQTRNKTRAAQAGSYTELLPAIPTAVQLLILQHLITAYPEPDAVEYVLFPFKSTLGWLLSLKLVNKQWCQCFQQHPVSMTRRRLEALRSLSLLHDYAHYIVTARASKKERIKAVPRKLDLHFADGSSCVFTVPKALTAAEKAGGLPSNALMLVAAYNDITVGSFKQMLVDIDCLDQRHAAPMVLKILTTASHTSRRHVAVTNSKNTVTSSKQQSSPGSSADCPCPATTAALDSSTDGKTDTASNIDELLAVARISLQDSLQHVVMEGSASSAALYFIPTKKGFCRRVPAAAQPN